MVTSCCGLCKVAGKGCQLILNGYRNLKESRRVRPYMAIGHLCQDYNYVTLTIIIRPLYDHKGNYLAEGHLCLVNSRAGLTTRSGVELDIRSHNSCICKGY